MAYHEEMKGGKREEMKEGKRERGKRCERKKQMGGMYLYMYMFYTQVYT